VLDAKFRLLTRDTIVQAIAATTSHETADRGKVANQIPQHDAIARREKLKQIAELGLKHMEDKKVSATLLGHEIVLQDVVADVAGAVEWAEDYVKDAVKDLPYASIVLAGMSLVLPLLKNPSAAEAANQDGFTYVTSQMRYYVAMESLLLPEHMKSDLRADLTERLMDLYKLIIDFQVQTVLRFYRSRTKNFFIGTINYDSWDKKLQDIKDGDKELVLKFEIAMSATSLDVLKNLVEEAEASRSILSSLLKKQQELMKVNLDQLGVAQDHLSFAQKMDRRMSNAENRACLQDLQATDPRDDKTRIERDKGGLLRDSYHWILENSEYQHWRDDRQSRLLWIRGDPGKGKTMLLCGIIDELIESTTDTANVSFFFCQATNADINNATAVLRGLIYMLVKQQRSLISHLRESYDDFGKRRFTGANAFVALSKIFSSILSDPCLQNTYLIIDALDECTTDLKQLLDLVQDSSAYSNVKWIVSSRNWPSIKKGLNKATQKASLHLELNEESVSAAVSIYIQHKVDWLATQNEYDNDTRGAVQRYLSSNANGTFLWVALVCQELTDISGWEAEGMLITFPPGLDALYRRMMDQICNSKNSKLCKSILAVASVVYRPITLDELDSFVDMPPRSSGNYKALAEIIGLCGSFLTLRERTISFVHQSAKDFLIDKASQEIFLSGIEDEYHAIFTRSLQVMSRTLRRDVYSLRVPGVSINQVK
jgi:DNA replication protein DnaC